MKARQFLFFAEDHAMARLGASIPRPERKVMWTILQLHYGDETVHYELQPQISRGQVEVGLHFEADLETNEARAMVVARHAAEVLGGLGDGWELEEWTASWRRLHRVFPIETRLDAGLAREVGDAYATLIATTHGLLDEIMGFEPQRRPQQATRGNHGADWRRRARAARR